MNINVIRLWLLVGVLACSLKIMGQDQVVYTDYRAMCSNLTAKFFDHCVKYGYTDMNQIRENMKRDMTPEKKVYLSALPHRRKKKLSGKDIYRLCKQSTLAIFQISHLKDGKYRTDFLATGVALTDKGVCATNYHVFKEIMSDSISNNILYFVMTAEGNVYPLQTLLAADGTNDFILFRIDTGKDKLVPLPLGKAAFEGEEIYCLSHPQGQLFYLTKGIVSRNQSLRVRSTGALKTEMQISADYAVGSSGGPVIDCRGNLVGLISTTTSLYPDRNSAMNFQMSIKSTVPVNLLLDCIVTSKKQ